MCRFVVIDDKEMAGLVAFFSELLVGDLGIGLSYEVARPGSLLVGVVCTT